MVVGRLGWAGSGVAQAAHRSRQHGVLDPPRPSAALAPRTRTTAHPPASHLNLPLQAAIRDPDPVCFLENELMYGVAFPVGDEVLDKDFTLPIGKAKVMREGSDVTLVSFSKMVRGCSATAGRGEE